MKQYKQYCYCFEQGNRMRIKSHLLIFTDENHVDSQSSLINDTFFQIKTLLLFPTPMASLWNMMMVSSSCLEMRGNTRGENREQLAMMIICGDHNNVTSGVRDWIMCQCALCRQTAGQWPVLACQWAQWRQCSPDQATASEY